MADDSRFETDLHAWRVRAGWSQDELARRAGLSRAGVGAIETGRLVPSVAAALALAGVLGCRVEDVFRIGPAAPGVAAWAWTPPRTVKVRFWRAEVGGVERLYPVEPTAWGAVPHDGVASADGLDPGAGLGPGSDPTRTLVLAGCDPAAGLLAAELARASGVRLLAFSRPSRAALDLLARGLVHVAGCHLGGSSDPGGNADAVRDRLGPGHRTLRLADWDEGIAFAPGLKLDSISAAMGAKLRWIGREPGSGARQCLDELLGTGRPAPRRQAADHRGVADAVRSGWADAGVCLRLAGEEAGLGFLPVRREPYDLCFPASREDDPRIRALVAAVRSQPFRRLLGDLPGYDTALAGEVGRVD